MKHNAHILAIILVASIISCLPLSVHAQTKSAPVGFQYVEVALRAKRNFDFKSADLRDFFDYIDQIVVEAQLVAREAGLPVAGAKKKWRSSIVENPKLATIKQSQTPVGEVLDRILSSHGLQAVATESGFVVIPEEIHLDARKYIRIGKCISIPL
jgi:hypothetical protein